MSVALFLNPHARANRRDPGLAADFARILDGRGRILTPNSLEDLGRLATELRQERPSVIAVHGGDGTLHRVLTAVVPAWGGEPLPPIATLCGGTMNVVATSLGIREEPTRLVKHLADCVRLDRPPATLRRRCIQVGDRFGFVFGNGLMANFLTEYYAAGGYGPGRAIWLLFRASLSSLWQGPFVRRIFRRFEGRVTVDGTALPWSSFTAVGAATVREVGLGFKLNHRADDDPDKFGVLGVHAGALSLMSDVPAVHAGRGVSRSHAWSGVGARLDIEPDAKEMSYTIDGDLYVGAGPMRISIGPALQLVKPPS